MKNLFPSIAIIFVFSTCFFAQNAAPSPTPVDDDVVKISTSLIQIDISVTDEKGKVLTDIQPEEIEIFENGVKQKITNFSFVSSIGTKAKPLVNPDKTLVPIPQATLRTENIRRTIALVVDDLSLSFESAYQTRRSLKKFVDEQMQEGDLVAIIRTGAGIGALQQFTSDKRVLYAAIEKVKWNPLGSGGIGAFAPIDAATDTSLQTSGSEEENTDEPAATGAGQTLDDFRNSVFATGTLGALRYIVGGMSELPGRKSVILFSDGFKLLETDANGFMQGGIVLDYLRVLVDLANRSAVVFYTIDARGLVTTGITAADSITDTQPQSLNRITSGRSQQLFDTQSGLSFLAAETGGIAIKNNNDLVGGVRKILEDQSYYLIGYEPDSDTFDAANRRFNKLEVKVTRKGAKVRYRSGFFNIADSETPQKSLTLTPAQRLQTALTSPFGVSSIGLRLNALFGNDEKTGSYVRSLLHVNVRDLKFLDTPDGKKKAVFDVLAVSFGDNGVPVDQIAKSYTLLAGPEMYARLQSEGFVYHFTFPVKKPGAYQYRVAVRDETSDSVGSASQFIEVPNLKKKRLIVSSVVLDSFSRADWKRAVEPNGAPVKTNPMADTALRRFNVGSVMRYGFEIYNARAGGVQTKIRVFRDGKLIFDGKQMPIDLTGQTDATHLKSTGAISIGNAMPPGDYILQIVVTDNLAKGKGRIATQFVQFEVE